jgi:hypothetical protein
METRLQAIERTYNHSSWDDYPTVRRDINELLSLLKECRGVIEKCMRFHDNNHLYGANCVCEMNESARQTLAKLE